MNLQFLFALWLVIFAALLLVWGMKWQLGRREDDHIHFGDSEAPIINLQVATAHKLDVLDRWKTALLVLCILMGLALGGLHAYNVWQSAGNSVL